MEPNELPQEIQDTVRVLAEAILADTQAQAYQKAMGALEADPEAAVLEKRFMDLYTTLNIRQQKGEQLSPQDIKQFYALRSEYYANSLVAARNDALGALKPLLAEAGENISAQIGLDFTELARPM